jgi:hypothetical protein
MLAIATAACGTANGSAGSGRQASQGAVRPIVLRADYDRLPFNTPQRMCAALLVTDGTVGKLGAGHWNTPGAARPVGADLTRLETRGYQIYTPLQLNPGTRNLVDRRSHSSRELAAIGGEAGVDRVETDSFPMPKPGGRYLMVFVPGQVAEGTAPDLDTLILIDAFAIDAHGNVAMPSTQLDANGRDVSTVKTVALSQLESQIAGCR